MPQNRLRMAEALRPLVVIALHEAPPYAYFVYMVLCDDGSYYVGVTNDADRRVAEHNMGTDPNCYTFTRRPVRLVYSEQFKDVDDAIRSEKQIKGWSRKKKAALVRGDWNAIVAMAREIRSLKK